MLFTDLNQSMKNYGYWVYSSWMEILLIYRATLLGPVWIIAGTALYIGLVGTLFQQVFGKNAPNYLPHVAMGIVLWSFLSQSVGSASRLLIQNRYMILSGTGRYTDYALKLIFKNGVLLIHNMVVVVIVFLFYPPDLSWSLLSLFATIPLFLLAVLGIAIMLSIVGARYRDVGELVHALFRIAFFVTPIVWMPQMRAENQIVALFLYLNPFYYLLEIIRAPIISGVVPWFEIGVTTAMVGIGWFLTYSVYQRTKPYVALWI